jgi:LmbE family N-acetylglucosaminyl deacetylase
MLTLSLPENGKSRFKVLCLGGHSDDIEIGCGGTILQWLSSYKDLEIIWVVFSSGGSEREKEARASAELFLEQAKKKDVMIKDFRDGFFPFDGKNIKTVFENELKKTSPDVILTHNRKDAHQDHRQIAELTWNTFRDHLILEYEIPKYDGDMGQPNLFVHLNADVSKKKVGYLMKAFRSQHGKRWFQEDTFFSLMRLRGMECNAPSGHAEAFYCRKVLLATAD